LNCKEKKKNEIKKFHKKKESAMEIEKKHKNTKNEKEQFLDICSKNDFALVKEWLQKKKETWFDFFHVLRESFKAGQPVVLLLLSDKRFFPTTSCHWITLMVLAVENGFHSVVKLLLTQFTSLAHYFDHHHDLLKKASCNGDLEMIQLLLADCRFDATGSVAFYEACENGRTSIVKCLLEAKCTGLDLTTSENRFGLSVACTNGYSDIVEMILQDSRFTPSQWTWVNACWLGTPAVVRLLVKDVRLDSIKCRSWSDVLCQLCKTNRFEVLQLLIEEEPSLKDKSLGILERVDSAEGLLKLAACDDTNHNVLEVLLRDSRLDPSRVLLTAISFHCVKNVQLLLNDKRIDPSLDDQAALVTACENGNLEIVHLLLKDPRVDPSDSKSKCLHYACLSDQLEVVKVLLKDKRVQPCYKNVHAAIKRNDNFDLTVLLLQDSRLVIAQKNYLSLFNLACSCGNLKIVQFFLKDPRISQHLHQEKFLRNAVISGCSSVALLLLEKFHTTFSEVFFEELLSLVSCDRLPEPVEFLRRLFQLSKHRPSCFDLERACYGSSSELVRFLLVYVNPALNNQQALNVTLQRCNLDILPLLLSDSRVDPSANNQFALHLAFRVVDATKRYKILSLLLNDDRVVLSMTIVKKYVNTTAPLHPTLLSLLLSFNSLCCNVTKHFPFLSDKQHQQVEMWTKVHQLQLNLVSFYFNGIVDIASIVLEYSPRVFS
jgi:ankyrin repeat protein